MIYNKILLLTTVILWSTCLKSSMERPALCANLDESRLGSDARRRYDSGSSRLGGFATPGSWKPEKVGSMDRMQEYDGICRICLWRSCEYLCMSWIQDRCYGFKRCFHNLPWHLLHPFAGVVAWGLDIHVYILQFLSVYIDLCISVSTISSCGKNCLGTRTSCSAPNGTSLGIHPEDCCNSSQCAKMSSSNLDKILFNAF